MLTQVDQTEFRIRQRTTVIGGNISFLPSGDQSQGGTSVLRINAPHNSPASFPADDVWISQISEEECVFSAFFFFPETLEEVSSCC